MSRKGFLPAGGCEILLAHSGGAGIRATWLAGADRSVNRAVGTARGGRHLRAVWAGAADDDDGCDGGEEELKSGFHMVG